MSGFCERCGVHTDVLTEDLGRLVCAACVQVDVEHEYTKQRLARQGSSTYRTTYRVPGQLALPDDR